MNKLQWWYLRFKFGMRNPAVQIVALMNPTMRKQVDFPSFHRSAKYAGEKVMFTALDKLKALLMEADIPFTVYDLVDAKLNEYLRRWPNIALSLKVETCNDVRNVTGYYDFYTQFYFDAEGNLLTMGAWE